MVDIALDPNMYYMTMSTPDTLRKARELGFDFVELSPNNELHLASLSQGRSRIP